MVRHLLNLLAGALFFGTLLLQTGLAAPPTFTISYDDPQGRLTNFKNSINSHILAAADKWKGLWDNPLGTIEILVRSDLTIPRATGRSLTSVKSGEAGLLSVYEQGASSEFKSGDDPNGTGYDVEFSINPNYVSNELWFDPDPTARTAPVSTLRTDAMSVFLHEWGHAFGFNGWLDTSGALPGNYMSTFDEHIISDGTNLLFSGNTANTIYGNAVPITATNPNHIGNNSPRPGSNLLGDLMNGVVFQRGARYDISPLDLGVLSDAGVPIRIPIRAGDVTLDGSVDALDASQVFADWGLSANAKDMNYDGIIDAADAAILFAQWTGDVGPTALPQSVPEPTCAWWTIGGCFWTVWRRRRAR